MNSSHSIFHKIGDWLEDFWVEALTGLFTVLAGISTFVFGNDVIKNLTDDPAWQTKIRQYTIKGVIIFFVCQAVFYTWSLFRKHRATVLRAKVERLEAEAKILTENLRNLIEGYLYRLAIQKLEFRSRSTMCERITLYIQDCGQCFVPIGRYASNPDHSPTKRSSYPINEGCIHEAWSQGWFFDNKFPDPESDSDGYIKHHGQYKISESTAKALTMKSRLYFGCRIMDQSDKNPVAVLIIESTDPNAFKKDTLRKALICDEQKYLSELINVLRPLIAVPSTAKKAGF